MTGAKRSSNARKADEQSPALIRHASFCFHKAGEVSDGTWTSNGEHYVYSDILREIAKQRRIEPTRANLQKLGNDVKKASGNQGILSRRLLDNIKTDKVVVDGIRNVDEIVELKKGKKAYIIGVIASQRVRFKRLRKRSREGDPINFSEFKRLDNFENRGKTRGQEINKCLKLADYIINNNGTLEQLQHKAEEIIMAIS